MMEKKRSTITKVEVQKYDKTRYSIYLDGEYSFGVSEDVLVKYSLLKGTELEEEFIEEVLLAEEKSKALSIALRYLGYRMRAKKEVADKLEEKGYGEYADYVLEHLEENSYLDDLEFAICFAKDKFGLNGFGQNRVRMELMKKGIGDRDISIALDEAFNGDEEYRTAKELALKKLNGSYRGDDRDSKYRKTSAYLYRRGYSTDLINSVLKEVL